jgi:hypothetical protein
VYKCESYKQVIQDNESDLLSSLVLAQVEEVSVVLA